MSEMPTWSSADAALLMTRVMAGGGPASAGPWSGMLAESATASALACCWCWCQMLWSRMAVVEAARKSSKDSMAWCFTGTCVWGVKRLRCHQGS